MEAFSRLWHRRGFLRASLAAGVAMISETAPAQGIEADVIIRGATLFDGSGKPGKVGDIALKGDRIVGVGFLQMPKAAKTIDAQGLMVAPGFIDLHTHGDI